MKDFLLNLFKDLLFLFLMFLMLSFAMSDLKAFTEKHQQKTVVCERIEEKLICSE